MITFKMVKVVLPMLEEFKQCTKCHETKPRNVDFFAPRIHKVDGLHSWCRVCGSKASTDWAKRNKARVKAIKQKTVLKNISAIRAYAKKNAAKYRKDNPEKVKKGKRVWAAENAEHCKEKARQWRLDNPGRTKAHTVKKRATKRMAMPRWADKELMEMVYAEANHRGLEVDHIVPLGGKSVCGLHIYYNTQLITKSENSTKHNMWPYEPRISF